MLPEFLGVLGVALACSPLLVAALRRRGLDAWCLAAPAALAAWQPDALTPGRLTPGRLTPGPQTPASLTPGPVRPGPVQLDGRVASRLILDDLRGDARCVLALGHDRVLCVFEGGTDLRPGDRVRARACLAAAGYAPHGAPRDRALPVATVPPGAVLEIERSHSLAAACESMRLAMRAALVAAVPGREGRLLAQLVLGHGGEVDADVAQAHRETGLSHLLAVSGAHVSLLAAMLAMLLRARHGGPAHEGLLLAAIGVYGTITGLDPPVVRALIGFALLLLARRLGRHLTVAAALAGPGLLTAIVWPNDARSVSFALSYAAVAGLALAPPPPPRPSRLRQRALFAIAASAWATLTTAPLTLLWFSQLAPWTILATPLLSPLVALMLALGLMQAACGALGLDLPWLALALRALAGIYLDAVQALATWPATPVLACSKPPHLALAAAALLGGVALWCWPSRRAVVGLCLALIAPHFVTWPRDAAPGLHLLAVGHGQAALLRMPDGRTAAIDCGSLQSARRAADALADALAPDRRLDLLVLSHGDADHTQGVAPLLRRVRIGAAVLPSDLLDSAVAHDLRAAEVPIHGVAAGQHLEPWSGLVLSRPPCAARAASNDGGLFTWADLGTFRVVLPGDAGAEPVRAHAAALRRAEVLVLPHHGRPHEAIDALLDAVQPRLALVSGGDPLAPCAQARAARRRGIPVLETEHVGSITVTASAPPRVHTAQPPPVWGDPAPR